MNFIICSKNKNECNTIYSLAYKQSACKLKNEMFNAKIFSDTAKLAADSKSLPLVEFACVDVVQDGAVKSIESFRKDHSETMLTIIADSSIMPTVYLKPSIMASSLLLRPIDQSQVLPVINDLYSAYIESVQTNNEKFFSAKTSDGNIRIAFFDILYFEAREKKIFLRTNYEEYSFYSSIEKIAEFVPEYFSQCHRSFLINRNKIQKIIFPENTIVLEGDNYVPLSRGFRSEAKGWLNNEK